MNPRSYKALMRGKKPGKKQRANLILQEFGSTGVMSKVDMKLIDFLYSSKSSDEVDIRKYVEKIIKESMSTLSTGRIFLTIKLIKKIKLSDLLDKILIKIKFFVQKKICSHSKKIKNIFRILKKVQINVEALIKEIEDKFKFPSHAALAYRMAQVQS